MPNIRMPGGVIEDIAVSEVWWMRDAFPEEWKGAVLIRLAGEELYSTEDLADLKNRLAEAGAQLADFTPPDRKKMVVVVNVANVTKVEKANPVFHHDKAKSVLVFSRRSKLAVRETEEEAAARIEAATPADAPAVG